MTKSPTSFKDQLIASLLAATPEATLRELAVDVAVQKAMEVGGAGQERPSAEMSDRVVDQSIAPMRGKVPGKEELKFGPTQAASGSDAERVIGQYSEPAPQQDIVVQYEKLSGMLGSLGKAMEEMAKSQATLQAAFAAILKKADEEDEEGEQEINIAVEENEEEEEEEGKGKSLSPAMQAYFRTMKADLLAKADDEEEEDEQEINIGAEEDEEEEAEKAMRPDSLLAMAKAIFLAAKAASGEKVAKGSRKRLAQLIQGAVRRAYGMAKKAEAAAPKAKALSPEIAEYAYLKGFSLKAPKPKAAADATGEIKQGEGEDHNQRKWATTGKAGEPTKDDVLKGMAVLNGNMATIMEALSGKGVSLPATPLALISKAAATPEDPKAALFKADMPEALFKGWSAAKASQIQAGIDSGEFDLADELASSTILATAAAVQAGATSAALLKARVNTASEKLRALFADVLEG